MSAPSLEALISALHPYLARVCIFGDRVEVEVEVNARRIAFARELPVDDAAHDKVEAGKRALLDSIGMLNTLPELQDRPIVVAGDDDVAAALRDLVEQLGAVGRIPRSSPPNNLHKAVQRARDLLDRCEGSQP